MRLDSDAALTACAGRADGRRCHALALLALGLASCGALAQGRVASSPSEAQRPYARAVASETAHAVARTTLGILEFAHWPGDPPEVRLCVVGATPYAGELLASRAAWLERGRHLSVRQRTVRDVAADCDAVYLGRLAEAEASVLHRRIAGQARITIVEGDAGGGAARSPCGEDMFCLAVQGPGKVGFAVNQGALARSGVRVLPGALQLGMRRAHGA